MASIAKYANITSIDNILRHNDRLPETYTNNDIDLSKSENNYYLSPTRGISSYSYFKLCIDKLYCYHRDNVVKLCEWVVSAPVGLTENETRLFFQLVYDFLINRYYGGEKYCIQAVVHLDEKNWRGHMHYCFIPAVKDEKHKCDKVCCWQVVNRQELRDWHPALQKYLIENGLPQARVQTGITRDQGGNRSVYQLKKAIEDEKRESGSFSYDVQVEYGKVM